MSSPVTKNDLSEARKKLEEQEKTISDSIPQREQMMLELARYKVQEKSLKLKVSSLQTSLSQQKSTSEAALKSASISTKQAVERAKEECGEIIGMYRDMIITLLCDNKLSRLSDNELVDTALPRIKELIGQTNSKTITDAIRLRRALGLTDGDSLVDSFKRLYNSTFLSEEKIKKLQDSLSESDKEKTRLARENKRLEHSKEELNEWIKWSRSLFRQVADTNPSTKTSADIRFVIEEQIYSSLS